MPTRQVVFALITFFHDLFTVAWIGGLFALALVVLPVALRTWGRGPETKRLMDAIQRRPSPLGHASTVGLAATGGLLGWRNPGHGGRAPPPKPHLYGLPLKHNPALAKGGARLATTPAARDYGEGR